MGDQQHFTVLRDCALLLMGFSPGLKKCPPDTFYPLQARVGLFESHHPQIPKKNRVAKATLFLWGG